MNKGLIKRIKDAVTLNSEAVEDGDIESGHYTSGTAKVQEKKEMNEITITLTEDQADIICRALSLLKKHDEKKFRKTVKAAGEETDSLLRNSLKGRAIRHQNRAANCVRLQNKIRSA